MRSDYLRQAWLVIAMALCFGGALAAVHVVLDEKIQDNKRNETLSQIPVLIPGATSAEAEIIAGRTVYRAMADGQQLGWVVQSAGYGFADRVELLIGLDFPMRTLTGLHVLSQKETPGLGNKIVDEGWRRQFADRPATKQLAVTKDESPAENEIRAITGATISSESVCETVNQAVAEVRSALATEGGAD